MNTVHFRGMVDDTIERDSESTSISSRHEGVLVVYPRDGVSQLAGLELRQGEGDKPLVAKSFAEACDAMLTCSFKVIVVLETSTAVFSPIEAHVIARMAGPADIVRMKLSAVPKVAPGLPAGARGVHAQVGNVVSPMVREGWRSVGGLIGEERTGQLWAHGNPLSFSKSEAAFVWIMLRKPNDFVSSSEFLSTMRNPDSAGSGSKLRQFIHRIRRKLSNAGKPAIVISNRKGYGLMVPE